MTPTRTSPRTEEPPRARGVRVLVDGRLERRRRTGVATYIRDLRSAAAEAPPSGVRIGWASGPPGFPRRGPVTSAGNLLLDLAWLHIWLPLTALARRSDVIHAPVNWGPWWSPVPVVVTMQDLTWERVPQTYPPSFRRYARIFARRTARTAAVVIATSHSTARDLVDLYDVDPERIRVVPIGVATDSQAPKPRERFVLAAGVMHPRKRIRQLVEGHALYWRRHEGDPDRCRLVIAGAGGSDEPAVRAAAGPGCELLGFVGREELLDLYRRASLLAYPSSYEGFGLPVLEAMAHGCPVLAAGTSSLPEVGGEVARYIHDVSPEALADALGEALSDEEDLRARGERGRAWAAGFSWERAVRETAAVYEEAAA
ncbi:MAG: glycosyltransferase family 4 protein [Miltoncostaeaceae bacterium]